MLQIKEGVNNEDLLLLNPKVFIVLGHFCTYAQTHGLPVTITSVISDRDSVKAASTTHDEGRAIDIRSYTWPKKHVKGVIAYMNNIAIHYGAISASDYQRRVIVHHKMIGGGEHFHLQVSR
jgi:hypothetical protein